MPAISSYQWLARSCSRWLLERTGRRPSAAVTVSAEEPPWDAVEKASRIHGVEPLLHDLARRRSPAVSAAPLSLKEKWEQAYYSTRIRNAEALGLLDAVALRAQKAGLPFLVVKGPAVIAAVYGDVGLRPMADLDLFCRTRDLPSFAHILRSLGFQAGAPYLHHLDFHRRPDEAIVELHFDLHHGVAGAERFLDRAWSGRRTATVEEWTFPVMSDEHQLVFELAHYAHHDFDVSLKNVVDFEGRISIGEDTLDRGLLAELLEETGLAADFEEFRARNFERASSFGLVRKRRTAGLFVRQRGFVQKALFLRKRLLPPLDALRAAHDLRSRAAASVRVPGYAARAIVELAFKLKAGF